MHRSSIAERCLYSKRRKWGNPFPSRSAHLKEICHLERSEMTLQREQIQTMMMTKRSAIMIEVKVAGLVSEKSKWYFNFWNLWCWWWSGSKTSWRSSPKCKSSWWSSSGLKRPSMSSPEFKCLVVLSGYKSHECFHQDPNTLIVITRVRITMM